MGIYTTFTADTPLSETIGIPILTGVGAGALYGTYLMWSMTAL